MKRKFKVLKRINRESECFDQFKQEFVVSSDPLPCTLCVASAWKKENQAASGLSGSQSYVIVILFIVR